MPTKKPRITITLDQRSHEVLSRLSAASGDSMSEIVAGFVDMAIPSLERVVIVLERAKAAPEEARAGIAAAIERADRTLMPVLQSAVDQHDLFLFEAMARTTPSAAPDAERPAKAGRRRSGAGSTPVPVTRGSGGPRKARKGVRGGTV
jgi:hypothetical protein